MPLFGGSRSRGSPQAGPRRPWFRPRRRRSLGRGRPTMVPGTRWRLADAVEVETRSDGDRTDGTEAGLGDSRPKPSHSTQKCPEDRSGDPPMGSEQLDYRNTCAAPIFRVSNTALTAPSRGAHGPFIGPVSKPRPQSVYYDRIRGLEGAMRHVAAMTAASDITANGVRSNRRRRSRRASTSHFSRPVWSHRTARPPPGSGGASRGAEGPVAGARVSSFGAATALDRGHF